MENRPAQRSSGYLQQRVPSQVPAAAPLPCRSPRTCDHVIKFFFCGGLLPPFFVFHISVLFSAFPPRLVMGARGEVEGGGGWRARFREWRARVGWLQWDTLSISGLPALCWGIRECSQHQDGGTPEPHVSRRASEGRRLGGDGALGWVAGERPYIIAFLPPPPPFFGFFSPFSFPSPFPHHQLHSVPFLPSFSSRGSLFLFTS